MKFGREYIQPSSEQLIEYESNCLTPESNTKSAFAAVENQNTFSKLLIQSNIKNTNNKSVEREKDNSNSDLLLEEIPKKNQNFNKSSADYSHSTTKSSYNNNMENDSKIKINKKQSSFSSSNSSINKTSPTKQSVDSSSKSGKGSGAWASTDNSDSEALSSSASLGRLFNNYYQHSFLPSGILDTKLIHSLILFMKKDLKLELKHEISITLARTSNNLVLQRFLEFQGAEILSNWLHQIKEKIQDLPNSAASASQNYLNNILLNLLIFCEKLNISLKDLKFSKIGKEVNKLAKLNLDNKDIHGKCVALVHKWKKIVEETKEGKKPESSSIAVAINNSQSGFDGITADQGTSRKIDTDDKGKKADLTRLLLLKGNLGEEALKQGEITAAAVRGGFDAEQDRSSAFDLLHKKKLHPDKEREKNRDKEKDRDNDKEKDRDNTCINAHDKNNKKYIFKFSFIKDFGYQKNNGISRRVVCNLRFVLFFILVF